METGSAGRNHKAYCHPPGSAWSPVAVSGTWQNKTPLGQVRSFPPNFSQAACRLQQTTRQTQYISWQACFPAKNGLGGQSLGGAPNSATVDWAASSLEHISVEKQFVVRRENKTKNRKNLKKLLQNNYYINILPAFKQGEQAKRWPGRGRCQTCRKQGEA